MGQYFMCLNSSLKQAVIQQSLQAHCLQFCSLLSQAQTSAGLHVKADCRLFVFAELIQFLVHLYSEHEPYDTLTINNVGAIAATVSASAGYYQLHHVICGDKLLFGSFKQSTTPTGSRQPARGPSI